MHSHAKHGNEWSVEQLRRVTHSIRRGAFFDIVIREKHQTNNGAIILKFFLNVSLNEQKRRFLSRINEPKKNWKFSFGDLKERALWPSYMQAYQSAIEKTATKNAPWYIIPADNKPIMRAMVANIVCEALEQLNLTYPTVNQKQKEEMVEAKEILENE